MLLTLLGFLGSLLKWGLVLVAVFALLEFVGLIEEDLRVPWPKRFKKFLWCLLDTIIWLGMTAIGLFILVGCWLREHCKSLK